MTPTPRKIHVLTLLLLALVDTAAARDRVPISELNRAGLALELANEVGAATYAPLELRYATEQLDQARQADAAGELGEARQLVEQSIVNSDLAVAKSRLGRTRETVQVQAAANARLRQDSHGEQPGATP